MSDVLRYYGLGLLACSGSELISETTSRLDICDFLERDWLIAKTSMFTEQYGHTALPEALYLPVFEIEQFLRINH